MSEITGEGSERTRKFRFLAISDFTSNKELDNDLLEDQDSELVSL